MKEVCLLRGCAGYISKFSSLLSHVFGDGVQDTRTTLEKWVLWKNQRDAAGIAWATIDLPLCSRGDAGVIITTSCWGVSPARGNAASLWREGSTRVRRAITLVTERLKEAFWTEAVRGALQSQVSLQVLLGTGWSFINRLVEKSFRWWWRYRTEGGYVLSVPHGNGFLALTAVTSRRLAAWRMH